MHTNDWLDGTRFPSKTSAHLWWGACRHTSMWSEEGRIYQGDGSRAPHCTYRVVEEGHRKFVLRRYPFLDADEQFFLARMWKAKLRVRVGPYVVLTGANMNLPSPDIEMTIGGNGIALSISSGKPISVRWLGGTNQEIKDALVHLRLGLDLDP